MPRRGSPYGPDYVRARARLLGLPCQLQLVCRGAPADSADHHPALVLHHHRPGSGCCLLRPACRACQCEQGARLAGARGRGLRRARLIPAPSRVW